MSLWQSVERDSSTPDKSLRDSLGLFASAFAWMSCVFVITLAIGSPFEFRASVSWALLARRARTVTWSGTVSGSPVHRPEISGKPAENALRVRHDPTTSDNVAGAHARAQSRVTLFRNRAPPTPGIRGGGDTPAEDYVGPAHAYSSSVSSTMEPPALARMDAVTWLRSLDDESVDLVITDPPYESLEKHRAVGTTTRLKVSSASSNPWFSIFPNARFPELFGEIYRVLRDDTHFYLLCDPETAFIAKPMAEVVGFW